LGKLEDEQKASPADTSTSAQRPANVRPMSVPASPAKQPAPPLSSAAASGEQAVIAKRLADAKRRLASGTYDNGRPLRPEDRAKMEKLVAGQESAPTSVDKRGEAGTIAPVAKSKTQTQEKTVNAMTTAELDQNIGTLRRVIETGKTGRGYPVGESDLNRFRQQVSELEAEKAKRAAPVVSEQPKQETKMETTTTKRPVSAIL
jgi:hypothetical protein